MARPPDVKRINKEDFAEDQRDLIDKLAFPINSFMEQTSQALTKNLDFSNLNRELITLEVTVNENGIPNIITQYKSNLKSRVAGHTCINASNITSPVNTPTSSPFISFVQNNQLVRLNKVTGLQANQRYQLVLESIGQ